MNPYLTAKQIESIITEKYVDGCVHIFQKYFAKGRFTKKRLNEVLYEHREVFIKKHVDFDDFELNSINQVVWENTFNTLRYKGIYFNAEERINFKKQIRRLFQKGLSGRALSIYVDLVSDHSSSAAEIVQKLQGAM